MIYEVHVAMVQAPTIKLAALSNVWNFGQLEAEKKEFEVCELLVLFLSIFICDLQTSK